MKIYTITCHDVYNVGASLQAYALATYLKQCGHQVEIIDYKPDYLSKHYSLSAINNSKYDKPILRELYLLAKFPARFKALREKRKAEFDHFTSEMLPTTNKCYSSNDDLKKNLPKADAYLAGSDQIWNCLFPNGKDPAFYLDFAPEDALRVSYAASFSTEDVPDVLKPQIKSWLEKLDAISVRETSGVEIVNRLGIPTASQVLDPVFLLSQNDWAKLAEPLNFSEPFVLLYDFDQNNEMVAAARKLANENGWKLYSMFSCSESDQCFNQSGPLTFLELVRNASFIVSNSFHATAFSLIFHKEFAVCKRREAINTRMQDLLALAGLDNRMIQADQLNELERINYEEVTEKLDAAIAHSKNYLDCVLREKDE